MQIKLNVDECKVAIANYVNSKTILNGVRIEPEHLKIDMQSEGSFDEREDVFNGVTIDIPCLISPPSSILPLSDLVKRNIPLSNRKNKK